MKDQFLEIQKASKNKMSNKLMTDVGESYEYLRILLEKRVEIVKIDLSILISKLIGYSILALFLLSLLGLLVASLLTAIAVLIAQQTGGIILGILVAGIAGSLFAMLVFFNRKTLIINPIASLLYSLLDKKNDI